MGNWLVTHRAIASSAAAAALGAIAWSGHAATLPLAAGLLPLVLVQPDRRSAYGVAASYYAGSTWSLVPSANTFFGPEDHWLTGVVLWLVTSLALAGPWAIFHFRSPAARLWTSPLALGVTSLPPLGLIGWASPLTAAGILFPGTGWLGILALAFIPTVLVRPRWGLPIAGATIALAHAIYPGDPPPPPDWQSVDTRLGPSQLESSDPIREWESVEWIQQRALHSQARVILFPESVVPRWNASTELFWEPTLAALKATGKTIVFGTTVGLAGSSQRLNGVMIAGANPPESFSQRVPVPLSMWNPLHSSGFPLRLGEQGSIALDGERAGILICYELLLTWPVLSASSEHPTILVGVANDYWASDTTIPAMQRVALLAWARLFGLPKLIAVNT